MELWDWGQLLTLTSWPPLNRNTLLKCIECVCVFGRRTSKPLCFHMKVTGGEHVCGTFTGPRVIRWRSQQQTFWLLFRTFREESYSNCATVSMRVFGRRPSQPRHHIEGHQRWTSWPLYRTFWVQHPLCQHLEGHWQTAGSLLSAFMGRSHICHHVKVNGAHLDCSTGPLERISRHLDHCVLEDTLTATVWPCKGQQLHLDWSRECSL